MSRPSGKERELAGQQDKERCESGRIGLTANELTRLNSSEGSNPSLSARRNPPGWPAVVKNVGRLPPVVAGGVREVVPVFRRALSLGVFHARFRQQSCRKPKVGRELVSPA